MSSQWLVLWTRCGFGIRPEFRACQAARLAVVGHRWGPDQSGKAVKTAPKSSSSVLFPPFLVIPRDTNSSSRFWNRWDHIHPQRVVIKSCLRSRKLLVSTNSDVDNERTLLAVGTVPSCQTYLCPDSSLQPLKKTQSDPSALYVPQVTSNNRHDLQTVGHPYSTDRHDWTDC